MCKNDCFIQLWITINLTQYCVDFCIFFDQIFEIKFSKITRQKFKLNIFCERVDLALSESFQTFNICRVIFEHFDLENWLRYGADTSGDKLGRSTVNNSYLLISACFFDACTTYTSEAYAWENYALINKRLRYNIKVKF